MASGSLTSEPIARPHVHVHITGEGGDCTFVRWHRIGYFQCPPYLNKPHRCSKSTLLHTISFGTLAMD